MRDKTKECVPPPPPRSAATRIGLNQLWDQALTQQVRNRTLQTLVRIVIQQTPANRKEVSDESCYNPPAFPQFMPPRKRGAFTEHMIRYLLRKNFALRQITSASPSEDEWTTTDLAGHIGISEKKLKYWVRRGWIHTLQRPFGGTWIVWANAVEVDRLRRLATWSQPGASRCPAELTASATPDQSGAEN